MFLGAIKWIVFLALLFPVTGRSDSPDALFNAGKFKDAAEALEGTWAASKKDSSALAYNAGTAWAQAGNIPRAYGFLLTAEQLAWGDKDIKNNLALVRDKLPADAKSTVPSFPFGPSIARLSPLSERAWALGGLSFLMLSLLWFGVKSSKGPGWALLMIAVIFFIPYGLIHWENSSPTAVVLAEKTSLRSGPGNSFSEIQTISGGSWLSVDETQDGWIKARFISSADKKETVGWILSTDTLPIGQ